MDKRNWFQKLFGYCPCCGKWFRIVRTARQASAYNEDYLNFFTGCHRCTEQNDEYWDAQWANIGGFK